MNRDTVFRAVTMPGDADRALDSAAGRRLVFHARPAGFTGAARGAGISP